MQKKVRKRFRIWVTSLTRFRGDKPLSYLEILVPFFVPVLRDLILTGVLVTLVNETWSRDRT